MVSVVVNWVASSMIFSWVASAFGRNPVIRPLHITAIRSDMRSTSSISEEIMMIDLP